MVAQVVHDDHIFDLAVLAELLEHALVELLEFCHGFFGVLLTDDVAGGEGGFNRGVLVNVLKH